MKRDILEDAIKKDRIEWQRHALEKMMERSISRRAVKCGADWIDDGISEKLEKIVDDARQKHKLVEVTTLSG